MKVSWQPAKQNEKAIILTKMTNSTSPKIKSRNVDITGDFKITILCFKYEQKIAITELAGLP